MRYSRKYIDAINFFLEKRDVTRGGVDGFDTPFIFNAEELAQCGLNEKDITEIMETMKKERAWITDGNGKEHEVTVLGNYEKMSNGEVEVKNCSTEQLVQYRNKVRKKLDKSVIEVNTSVKKIRYGDNQWLQLSNAGRWSAFYCLYKNFPRTVSYIDIWDELAGYGGFNGNLSFNFEEDLPETRSDKKRIKEIQNIINGLQRRMNLSKYGFPPDAIRTEKNMGYKLTI